MDNNKNQIYKISKYLNKYTQNSNTANRNKMDSYYLKKLDNYFNKVQHGGQLDQLLEQIQQTVVQVVEKNQESRIALQASVEKAKGVISDKHNVDIQLTENDTAKVILGKMETWIEKNQKNTPSQTTDLNPNRWAEEAEEEEEEDLKKQQQQQQQQQQQSTSVQVPSSLKSSAEIMEFLKKYILDTKEFKFSVNLSKMDLSKVDLSEQKIIESTYEELIPYIWKLLEIIKFLTTNEEDYRKFITCILYGIKEIKNDKTTSNGDLQNIAYTYFTTKQYIKPSELLTPASSASSASASEDLNQLETNKFDVLGYDVDPSTGRVIKEINESQYVFLVEPTKSTIGDKEVSFLANTFRMDLLRVLGITDRVNVGESFKTNKPNTTFRVVLQQPENIRQFVDSVNNKSIIVSLQESLSSMNTVPVRLFIRPMTYQIRQDGNQNAINKLGSTIDIEILKKVSQQTQQPQQQQQQQQQSQSQSHNPSNPQTDKFDVIGFTIDRDNNPNSYVIPQEQEQKNKVLELLPQALRVQIKKGTLIELLSRNTKARITFATKLPVKETLRQVNNFNSPIKVQFTTLSSYPLNVYLFMVPMTYRIDDKTEESIKPTFKAINDLAEQEMDKINQAMAVVAQKRVESKQTQASASSKTPSASPAPAPSASQVPAPSASPKTQSASPRGRGGRGGFRGGSLSSRGPYHHPIEEYNL